MALETVVNIADLVKTNPTASDPKSQGDDHLRNLKTVLLNDFAGFLGALAVTGTDGGAANAYTLTPVNALPAYGTRMIAVFAPTVANTGACTLNISGLGVKNILNVTGGALVTGDLTVGTIYLACYDGTAFRLTSITKNYADQLVFSATLPAPALGFMRCDGATYGVTQTHAGYAQNEVKGADIASAATINLTTMTGNFGHLTGSGASVATITIPVGAERVLVIDGVNTIVHSASLLCPGAANITTAANDRMTVRGDTAGAIVVSFDRANGTAVGATPFLHVRDEKGSGVAGGASISGTQNRSMNTTVTNTISGASLSASQVTLPPGTYEFEITAPAYMVGGHQASLYNATDAATTRYGTSQFSSNTAQSSTRSIVTGRATITAQKTFNVQHYTAGAVATQGLGIQAASGLPEVYTEAKFWKVA